MLGFESKKSTEAHVTQYIWTVVYWSASFPCPCDVFNYQ
jgi:hypothetical protein